MRPPAVSQRGAVQTIVSLGKKARDSTLSIDEMSGGTFTISNGGVYGSLLSTPIINPPQSAIMGMHSIQQRPMVVGGEIKARPMMYIALTYDHRLIDGREVRASAALLPPAHADFVLMSLELPGVNLRVNGVLLTEEADRVPRHCAGGHVLATREGRH